MFVKEAVLLQRGVPGRGLAKSQEVVLGLVQEELYQESKGRREERKGHRLEESIYCDV